jgi:hypothetical protein
MIVHTVLFRFRPGFDWSRSEAHAAEKLTGEHPHHIDVIRTWLCGRNVTARDNACDFAVVATFRDREALDRYMTHEHHRLGIEAWRAISTWTVVDLEVADQSWALG